MIDYTLETSIDRSGEGIRSTEAFGKRLDPVRIRECSLRVAVYGYYLTYYVKWR
jgi:hypothetical protein